MGRPATFPPKPFRDRNSARAYYQGKYYSLGVWDSPEAKAEYDRLVAEWTEQRQTKPSSKRIRRSHTMTVREVVERWQEAEQPRYKKTSPEPKQFRYALTPLLALYGDSPAGELDADALEEVQLAMLSGSWLTESEKANYQKRGHAIGRCPRVVNRHVVRIRTLWKWAERKKLVPQGSYHHLTTLPPIDEDDARAVQQSRERIIPTWDDVQKVMALVPPPVAAILHLGWLTGMRPSEMRTMRAADVDRSSDVWLYRPPSHKTAHRGLAKVVPLGPLSQAVLATYLENKGTDDYVFNPVTSPRNLKGGFTPGAADRCYTDNALSRCVARAAKSADVVLTPYALRHAAKMRIARECGLEAAKAILGHQSIEMTNSYGTVDVGLAIEAARKVG